MCISYYFSQHNDKALKNRVYIETYGCQMNLADSEIVASLLSRDNYAIEKDINQADYILINTCAIRDNAEQRIRKRLRELRALQRGRQWVKIGILGCMAERLQKQLMEEEDNVSFIVGPDAYRQLPQMLDNLKDGEKLAETLLSETETYDDIEPVRYDTNGITAYISIMRGCQNYCAYCVVPYTRGRERSRDPRTIVDEARTLFNKGYREVTLLGQNVNSYRWEAESGKRKAESEADAATSSHISVGFPQLMAMVAEVSPLLRVRFATSHPKDLSDELLQVMARYDNICKCIHLPVQSGSARMLKLMNRHYTPEWYLDRIDAIRRYLPECSITTDVIAGFCTETEEDHQATLEMFRRVRYDYAYMFKFSMRPNTYAAKHLQDDIPDDVKTRRLEEIIALQGEIALENNQKEIGKTFEVLIEGVSHRSDQQLFGRNSQNKVIVFERGDLHPGQYANVKVTRCTSATLIGEVVDNK
ncbi:MAG: tRNA (N6-isopentenyl adenosine(37)-C2)-methylthiotransferase MiaB [Bacteroidales bacterium]|nr:tRNA (N6-isopentenyl adenosine(37)-C2)-methylthiotransferase MiaB [Bacteroidales bacterium]